MKLSPYKPIDPRKFPFYYGWFLISVAVIGILMSMPGQTAGFSAFTEPLLGITGFSRTLLSIIYMTGTVISGFILPYMGKLIDSWGSRRMMMLAAGMLGFSLFWLSFIDQIVNTLTFIPTTPFYLVLLVIGVFSLRFFGQGLLPVISNTMIGKWFDRKRGRAMAFLGIVNSVAFSVTPAFMAALVGALEWNHAWRLLAVITAGGMGSLAYLFFRDSPEECGLSVDGEDEGTATDEVKAAIKRSAMYGIRREHAVRTRSFWAVVLTATTHSLVNTGLTFHIQEIGQQAGLTLAESVAIFIPVAFIGVPLGFIAAILTDRLHTRWFVYFMAASQILAYVSVSFLETPVGYVLTIVGLGFSSGMMGPMQTAIMPKLFGRLHLGSINGLMTSTLVIGSALGPVLLSGINDLTGSLRIGVTAMSGLSLVGLLLTIKMPERFEHLMDERDIPSQYRS
ncbi:MAG: MFS transporter [Spirochaetota bacterium]